jgi:cellulose synthase/poly-beta-1,6-N-acetylglucosamine synthase-like glycosyltransferase
LNRVIPRTHGDILVLSDANTMYWPDAIQKLVRHFADPSVGAVSGDVRLVEAADTHAHSEGLYYRYERGLQHLESDIGSMIGVDGAMYAVARHCFRPPADHTVVDDLVISMTAARLGYRVLYEPQAVAIEDSTSSSQEEFRRKSRIVAGGIQAFLQGQGVPGWRQPLLLFCYVSHKLLRWALPFFLLWWLAMSWILSAALFYQLVLWAQVLFYGGAVGYALNVLACRKLRWVNIAYYFCLVNGAALVGCCKGLFGMQAAMWQRTQRS